MTNREPVPNGVPPWSDREARLVSDLFEAFAAVLAANEARVVRRVGDTLAEAAAGRPADSGPGPAHPPEPRG